MLRIGWMPEGPDGEKQGADDLLAKGATVEDVENYLVTYTGQGGRVEGWPTLAEEAYHGLAGKIVKQILPHTEADPAALLFSFLIYVGAMLGRGAHFKVEGDTHYLKEFAVLVGDTSKGRKGTSEGRIRELVLEVNEDFIKDNTATGLSSGEGLIEHVRDPKTKVNRQRGETEVVDEGVVDKRLVITEPEFASPLTVMSRDGNTLSMVLRNAWDDRILRIMTRNNPVTSTGSHVAVLGHVSMRELRRHLTEEKLGGGIANRFLFAMVRRQQALPHGGRSRPVMPAQKRDFREAIAFGQGAKEIPLGFEEDPVVCMSAMELWEEVYPNLSEGEEGLFGSVTSRAEVHVRKIATLYAVLDKAPTVGVDHLLAGLAVWQYAEDSARFLFGDMRGDPIEDTLLEELRHRGEEGMTKTEISDLFNRNYSVKKINAALTNLLGAELVIARKEEKPKGERGPRVTRYYAKDAI